MNRRFASVLVFSLIVSAIASSLVYHFVVVGVQAASNRPVEVRKLLVAARTLEAGTLIQDRDLRWIDTGEIAPPSVVNNRRQVVGRGVIATIFEGEAIVSGRLALQGAGAGLAAMIPEGKRAVALKIDEVVGLAGFVVPGMRVDVIVAARDSNPTHNNVTSRTVLQNIEVLSAGQKFEKTADGRPQDAEVVNLLVTPDEAEVLSLASSECKVQLVLRNPLDTSQQPTHGTSISQLFGHELPRYAVASRQAEPQVRTVEHKTSPAPASLTPTIEVFNGTKKSEQTLAEQ
jgi:pilus assembly protein CpaB